MPDGRGDWRRELDALLAARGVAPTRRVEIAAEVAQHLADAGRTSLDPGEAARLALAGIERRVSLEPRAPDRQGRRSCPRSGRTSGTPRVPRGVTRLQRDRDRDARARHRRQRGDLQRHRRRAAAPVYPDMDRIVVLNEATRQGDQMSVAWPTFQDWQARAIVRAAWRLQERDGQSHGRRTGRAPPAPRGLVGRVRGDGIPAAARPRVLARRRRAGRGARGDHQRAVVAPAVRRRSRHSRPIDRPQQRRARRRRRHAGRHALSVAVDRRLAADRSRDSVVSAVTRRPPRAVRRREAETRRARGARGGRHGRGGPRDRAGASRHEPRRHGPRRGLLRPGGVEHPPTLLLPSAPSGSSC